jgi:parallel beta-helix repeat protein
MSSANARMRVLIGMSAVLLVSLLGLSRDAGAAPMTFVVNTSSNPGASTCTPAECTLTAAINGANSNAGADTIRFDPVVFPPVFAGNSIDVFTPLPEIDGTDGITIDASDAGVVIDAFGTHPSGDGLVFSTYVGHLLHNVTVKSLNMEYFEEGKGFLVCPGGRGTGSCGYDLANVTFENSEVRNNDTGLLMRGASFSQVSISGSHFDDNSSSGIYINSIHVSGLSISNSTASNDGLASIDSSIDVRSDETMDNVQITASQVMTGTGDGIRVHTGLTGAISHLTIHGNIIDSPQQGGIEISPGMGLIDSEVSGNMINKSGRLGIEIFADSASGDTIEQNVVTNGLSDGIVLNSSGSGNVVRGNTITGNSGAGIYVTANAHTVISRNSTSGNTGLGINLIAPGDPANGVTPNDPGDADTGPNDLLNFPVIAGSTPQAVTGTACNSCKVELFLSDNDPSGYGEGKQFLADATADASTGDFSVSICGLSLNVATKVTATATDTIGNTSEFSHNYALTAASGTCPTPSPSPTRSPTPTPTPTHSPTPTPTHSPTPTGGAQLQGDLDCSGAVTGRDGLIPLLHDAGLPLISRHPGCPSLTAGAPDFADVTCDGSIDQFDGLAIVAYAAGATPMPQTQPCTPIGQPD